MAAPASCSPAPPSATCRRSPISPASPTTLRLCRSRPRPERRPATGRAICCSSSASRARKTRTASPAARHGARALARVLAPEPDILLLDEPTNHLDLPAIEWLESELAACARRLVLISHDRRFLADPIARHGLARSRHAPAGSTRALPPSRPGATQVLEEEELDRHKLDRQIVARGALAALRRHRPAQAQHAPHGRARRLCASERREQRARDRRRSGCTPPKAEHSGKLVIEAEHVSKSFGDRADRRAISRTRILRGDRLGIVGANGAGKTTLLNLLTGELPPDAGTRPPRHQSRAWRRSTSAARASTPTSTLAEALTGGGSDTVIIDGEPQARRRLHEGLPVRARAGAHRRSTRSRAASAAG